MPRWPPSCSSVGAPAPCWSSPFLPQSGQMPKLPRLRAAPSSSLLPPLPLLLSPHAFSSTRDPQKIEAEKAPSFFFFSSPSFLECSRAGPVVSALASPKPLACNHAASRAVVRLVLSASRAPGSLVSSSPFTASSSSFSFSAVGWERRLLHSSFLSRHSLLPPSSFGLSTSSSSYCSCQSPRRPLRGSCCPPLAVSRSSSCSKPQSCLQGRSRQSSPSVPSPTSARCRYAHKFAAPPCPNLLLLRRTIQEKFHPILFYIKNDTTMGNYVYDQHFKDQNDLILSFAYTQGILCSPLFEGKSYKEINLMVARVLEDIGMDKSRVKLHCQPPSLLPKMKDLVRKHWPLEK